MAASPRFYELRGNPHATTCSAHRAFDDIADAEFASDLLHVDCLSFVYEAGIAGDHEKPTDTRECGDDLLNHALREILLLRIATHVSERQHSNGGLVRQRQGLAHAVHERPFYGLRWSGQPH